MIRPFVRTCPALRWGPGLLLVAACRDAPQAPLARLLAADVTTVNDVARALDARLAPVPDDVWLGDANGARIRVARIPHGYDVDGTLAPEICLPIAAFEHDLSTSFDWVPTPHGAPGVDLWVAEQVELTVARETGCVRRWSVAVGVAR